MTTPTADMLIGETAGEAMDMTAGTATDLVWTQLRILAQRLADALADHAAAKDALAMALAEVEQLRRDRERLDWIEAHDTLIERSLEDDPTSDWAVTVGGKTEPAQRVYTVCDAVLRAAIDFAMEE